MVKRVVIRDQHDRMVWVLDGVTGSRAEVVARDMNRLFASADVTIKRQKSDGTVVCQTPIAVVEET